MFSFWYQAVLRHQVVISAVTPSSAYLIQLRITHLIILPAISGDSADISIAVLKAPGPKIELLEYHAPPTATDPTARRSS